MGNEHDRPVAAGRSATETWTPPTESPHSSADAETACASVSVPGYQIIGELGRGGMGIVFKARQVALDRTVALKMVLAGMHASTEEVSRFRTEAGAAARLQHDNIVKVFEVGAHLGQPYFTLEYVDGGNLSARLRGQPQSFDVAAELIETLARAVHYAHESGIVHRDLKPANILLTPEGTPKIADFGLAKRLENTGEEITRTGAVLGTPGYMSPEQAGGKKSVGRTADVYALGAILYEALTGRPPFQADSPVEVLQMVLNEEPISPAWLRPNVPRDLETVCMKCLQKDPARRYATAAELADDLRRFRAGTPISARPIGIIERSWKWARRRPTTATIALVVVGVLIWTVLGGWWYGQREARQAKRERELRDQAEGREVEARRALYETRMTLAWQAWDRADIAQVLKLLESLRPGADESDLRGADWHYLWRLSHGEKFKLSDGADIYFDANYSSDGRTIIAVAADGNASLWDAIERKKLTDLPGHKGTARFGVFSRNGKLAATGGREGISRIWDVQSRKLLRECRGHQGLVYGGAFSPNGKTLATAGRDGKLLFWDTSSGSQIASWTVPSTWLTCVAYSPDGATVAVGAWGRKIHLIDAATHTERKTLEGHTASVWSVAFSPDGERLFSASFDAGIRVWDTHSGKELAKLDEHSDGIWSVAISSDGRTMASGCYDSTIRLWDLATLQPRATLRGHTSQVRSVAFSPDNRTLISASADGTLRGWDATVGQGLLAVDSGSGIVRSMIAAPDGVHLIVGSREGTLTVRNFHTGAIVSSAKAHTSDILGFSWSRDGKTLVSSSQDKLIVVWDWNGRELIKRSVLEGSPTNVTAIALAPDGKTIASGCEDGAILLWDAASRKSNQQLLGHTNRVTCLAFARDGHTLYSASRDKTLRIWDVAQHAEIGRLTGHTGEVKWFALSADGAAIASVGYDSTVRLWDLAARSERAVLKGHSAPVWAVAISPDGSRIFSAGGERARPGEIRIWDVAAQSELVRFEGHAVGITALALAPDGKRLATVDGRGIIKIWDVDAEIARAEVRN